MLPTRGHRIGNYVLEELRGEGGMGAVYAARHLLLDHRVALKLLKPDRVTDGDSVARFFAEARASAKIDNDHVARVLEMGTADGVPFLVIELLEGTDLATLLEERGALGVAQVVDHLLQAIEGIAHAHALGIVHRDIKPSNLFLARRPDGTSRVKVLDFGISKVLGDGVPSMTHTNGVVGSPLYMSPEQIRAPRTVDARTDIWSIGVVAYELLTGRTPFKGETSFALFEAIVAGDAQDVCALRPDVPPALSAVVARCIARDRDERYESAAALAAELAPFGTEIGARACENARRILTHGVALAATTRALEGGVPARREPVPRGDVAPGDGGATALGAAETAYAHEASARPARAPRRLTLVGLGAVGAVASLGLVSARLRTADTSVGDHAASATAVATTTTSVPASSLSSSTTVATASAKPDEPRPPTAQPSSSALPTSSTGRTNTGNVSPRKGPVAVALSAAPASAAPVAPPNCSPPYEFDETGRKRWKVQCLQ